MLTRCFLLLHYVHTNTYVATIWENEIMYDLLVIRPFLLPFVFEQCVHLQKIQKRSIRLWSFSTYFSLIKVLHHKQIPIQKVSTVFCWWSIVYELFDNQFRLRKKVLVDALARKVPAPKSASPKSCVLSPWRTQRYYYPNLDANSP